MPRAWGFHSPRPTTGNWSAGRRWTWGRFTPRTRCTAVTEFTDNKPGRLQIVSDQSPTKEPVTTHFEPERDTSVYGHGATAIRYMRHLQDCLDEDREPSPNVLDGARACAVAAAAWGSADTRKPVAVFNEF